MTLSFGVKDSLCRLVTGPCHRAEDCNLNLQVETEGDLLTSVDFSSSGECLAFGGSGGFVHLWGFSAEPRVNLRSNDLELPPLTPQPATSMDEDQPFSVSAQLYYTEVLVCINFSLTRLHRICCIFLSLNSSQTMPWDNSRWARLTLISSPVIWHAKRIDFVSPLQSVVWWVAGYIGFRLGPQIDGNSQPDTQGH